MKTSIVLPSDLEHRLRSHLGSGKPEQVAFMLADYKGAEFVVRDLLTIAREGFEHQSALHVRLTDSERARVIKWAWDLRGSLIEAHVHRFDEPAGFSRSDRVGLSEFLPHIWWRLRGRPYGALVFGPNSFDGIAWISGVESPVQVSELRVPEGRAEAATGLSLRTWHMPAIEDD